MMKSVAQRGFNKGKTTNNVSKFTSPSSFTQKVNFSSPIGKQKFKEVLAKELSDIKEAGTYKRERVITSPQQALIYVQSSSKPVINFCANNYLGLANDPEVKLAAKNAIDTHGNGLSSVRFICGTQDIHKNLERQVAKFHEKEDSIIFPSCFDANAGIFETLLSKDDAVLSDELNHASIIDGIRLSKAKRYRYKHLDLDDLEVQLKQADQEGARTKLVVSDGVFSMDGDIAPISSLADVCEKYDAIFMIDECHATGFIGKTGRGTPEYYNAMDRVDIINSTFGKTLGGASGGYTTGSAEVIDLLRQRARPYLFSNTIAPSVAAAASKAIELIDKKPELIERLSGYTKYFRKSLTDAGFTLRGKDHPIVPVMFGDARLASEVADAMLTEGIYVIGFSYPVVPKGLARIRVQLSAAHSQEDLDRCINAFIKIGKEKGVIN